MNYYLALDLLMVFWDLFDEKAVYPKYDKHKEQDYHPHYSGLYWKTKEKTKFVQTIIELHILKIKSFMLKIAYFINFVINISNISILYMIPMKICLIFQSFEILFFFK